LYIDAVDFDDCHFMILDPEMEEAECTNVDDVEADCCPWCDSESLALCIPDQCGCFVLVQSDEEYHQELARRHLDCRQIETLG
jgi:hypothetical protein